MKQWPHKQTGPLKRVLLVEDDEVLNNAFYTLLMAGGYEVCQAYNGKEALEKIPEFQPEIILLDLLMPIMSGNEFLRAFDNVNRLPIIVFSNLDSHSNVREALENGATRYMLKSWSTPEELYRVINNTVGI
jgi:two-component system response regulator VicR